MPAEPIVILLADDDKDDCLFAKQALEESRLHNDLRIVSDGEQLLDYLRHRPPFEQEGAAPRPGLILLDLNMPRMDGREALREIKSDPNLRRIPVVVLTTSKAEEDVYRTYDLGVNSFISKPITFEGLVQVMKGIGQYWFELVRLPDENGGTPGAAM